MAAAIFGVAVALLGLACPAPIAGARTLDETALGGLAQQLRAELRSEFAQLRGEVAALHAENAALERELAAVRSDLREARQAWGARLPFEVDEASRLVTLPGYSLQIYAEPGAAGRGGGNLLVGRSNFHGSATNSLLVGHNNTAIGDSTVVFGSDNRAAADFACITGGAHGLVRAEYGAISGGYMNEVSGPYKSISGGRHVHREPDLTFRDVVMGFHHDMMEGNLPPTMLH